MPGTSSVLANGLIWLDPLIGIVTEFGDPSPYPVRRWIVPVTATQSQQSISSDN